MNNAGYVVVAQGGRLRLYPVKIGVGVGRRGRTDTFLEVHADLLADADAAHLWLLFSGEALAEDGSLDRLLHESERFAGDLAERLRDRVYGDVVPLLARGLAAAPGLKKPNAKDLADTYEMAMTVLFRLLFIAYGEDKDLLPYEFNGLYQRRSLRNSGTLPCYGPRIAFRDGTNRLNERTVIAALVPPKVFLGNQAPFLLWPRGTRQDEAYVLGILCSLPLDWYAPVR